MCGIVGFVTRDNPRKKVHLERMMFSQAHRGPDAHGVYFDGIVGLGHTRLSIIDLSERANQPMYSKDNRYVIVFNGEIYNYQNLARKHNLDVSTASDTEVVLELFIKHGVDFVKELNGMFAMAVFDTQQQELFFFRDRMGIKPLYIYKTDTELAFSSELKGLNALFHDKELPLDQQAINEFLHLGYIPQPLTIFRDIQKFPSGCFGRISLSKFNLEINNYWSSKDQVQKNTQKLRPKAAKARLDALVNSSVKYRMISDVPLGTFLSGGTDSSLITAVAQANSSQQVKTFSIGFKEAKFNESQHAAKVARHLNTDHHEFILSKQDAMEQIDRLTDIYDEPYADSSAVPTLLVSEMAKKHVTVTLSGDGGDELFLGYNMYNWARRLKKPWIHLIRKPISMALSRGDNRQKRAATLFQYPNSQRMKSHIFSQEQYLFSETEIGRLRKTGFSSLTNDLPKTDRKLNPAEEQAFYDLNYYLRDDLLVKVDRASMHHALETRVPLLDHRIVEFALNLSPGLKQRRGIQKYLLKQVLYDYIPKHIMERPKWGFSIPLIKWLKRDLAYLIDDYLTAEILEKHQAVNTSEVLNLVKRFRAGEAYLYNRLWSLIVLHKFLEKHHG